MTNRSRARRAALAVSAATLLVVTLNPPAALADTGQPSIIPGSQNGSDPHIDVCNVGVGVDQRTYMCMYTSQDMTSTVPGMLFPMERTNVYTLDTSPGVSLNPGDPSKWTDRGGAFIEDQLPLSKGTKHLWAPTMHYGNGTRETLLYVPDIDPTITIPGLSEDGHPSYIAVATSYSARTNNPWGPFTYKQNITYLGADINPFLAQSFPNGELPYMSDPAVATVRVDGRGPTTFLLWANGDYNPAPASHSKCGGISIGQLDDEDFTNLVSTPWRPGSEVQINGIAQALGECSPGLGHPYLEGPEFYDLTQVNIPLPGQTGSVSGDPYMLMFAAKPEKELVQGQGVPNQVLAYATAKTPIGPYTYRGILMDGSDTSWTNHGSIYATTVDDGPDIDTVPDVRFLIFFHDESSPTQQEPWHHRKARAACLTYDKSDRAFRKATRQPMADTSIPNLQACTGVVE